MALEGTIRDFGLPDIFQLIGLQRKTGTLTLTNEKDDEVVTVTFENGMVVMADASAHRLEDRLGNVLVKQGKLTRERLEEALAVQKQTLQRLGHILAGTSAITTRDLRDALQIQVSQIVFRVFRWRDGRYQFAPSDSADYDRENFAPMSTDFILMEGIRMVDEWPIIEKKIPSFAMVFRPVVDPALIEVASSSESDTSAGARGGAASSSGRIRLSAEEERIFRKVDGVRTVQAIIDSTGIAEFEACRILFDFLNRNLIGPSGRGPSGQSRGGRAGRGRVRGTGIRWRPPWSRLLALAGLGFQLRAPFAVPGLAPMLRESHARLQDSITRSRLAKLELAIEAWRASYGVAPQDARGAGEGGTRGPLVPARLVGPSVPLRIGSGRAPAHGARRGLRPRRPERPVAGRGSGSGCDSCGSAPKRRSSGRSPAWRSATSTASTAGTRRS